MRLGLLSQWFDPETGPAALPGVYAREFACLGHDVDVLTGLPNYPTGRLYPGYRWRARSSEQTGRIRVHRVGLYPDHSRSSLRRAANYASFALSASVLGAGALKGVDAIWAYNSPVTVAAPLLLHSQMGRTPYFYHVQDLWPESVVHSGIYNPGQTSLRLIRTLERACLTRAKAVGVISPSVRDLLLNRYPELNPVKIFWVPNPTDERLFYPEDPDPKLEQAQWRRPVVLMYLGALGAVQGLDTLLDTARLLLDRPELGVVLIGDGAERARLQRRVEEERIENVTFLDRIDKGEVRRYIASSDIQLVSLANAEFLRHTTPSKISTIMASGRPIVGQIAGDGADVIRKAGAGLVSEPGDPAGLAEAIRRMIDPDFELAACGRAARTYYQQHLSAAAAARSIVGALAS